MANFSARRIAACAALLTGLAQLASAADILIVDAKSQPESLTVAPGGILIVGSASTPFVYKIRPGSTIPEKFVDASAEGAGTFFFGMLADAATNTLWTCQLTPVADVTPVKRHTALRAFDLSTGAQKTSVEPARRQQHLQRFRYWTGQGALHHRHRQQQDLQAAGWCIHGRSVPGRSRTLRHRRDYLPEWHALCEQRVLEQSLPHPGRRRGQSGAASRYLDGSADKRTGWHASRKRKTDRCREWQR